MTCESCSSYKAEFTQQTKISMQPCTHERIVIENIFESIRETDVPAGFWEYYQIDIGNILEGSADGLVRFVSDMIPFLSPSGRLLSVGCGYGLNEIVLSFMTPGIEVVGVDILDDKKTDAKIRSMQAVIRRLHAELVTPLLADGGGLPFRDGSFDCVLAIDSISHADYMREKSDLQSSQRLLLMEMSRVVRPGGRLGVVDNSVMSPRNVMLRSGTLCHPVNPFYLKSVLEELDFEEVKISPYLDLTGRIDARARFMRALLTRSRTAAFLLAPLFMLSAKKHQ